MSFRAPQQWRLKASGGAGEIPPRPLEHPADVALGRPTGDRDASIRAADTAHLGGGSLVVRREHMADRGDDAVVAVIVEWKRLGIAFKPLDLDVGLGTAFARGRDQTRRKVQAVTRAPAWPPGWWRCLFPQATSSTFIPGSMPAARTMMSPMEVTFSATARSRRFPMCHRSWLISLLPPPGA